jgi:heptosyltransferase I
MKRGTAKNRLLDFYLGIPLLNLFATLRRRATFPDDPRRIGVFVNPALGDTLLASGITQDLRDMFSKATLILFAAKSNVAAAQLLPGIDEIRVIPITQPRRAIRLMRQARLNVMLDFTSWQRITAFFTMMSGARFTVGFERKGQYRDRGYDLTVPHLGDCHELENMRRLVRSLGAESHHRPRLLVPDGPVPIMVKNAENFVVFHAWATGTLHALREWPEQLWVELGKRLTEPGRTFLLTGGPADEPRCEALRARMTAEGISVSILIGRGGIAGVARVLRRAEMLITVNTGIMHLASIMGVPTVALNGPNSADRWGPIGEIVANVPTCDGSGGFLDLGFEFDGRNVMDRITVDSVIQSIQQLHAKQQTHIIGDTTEGS